MKDSERFCGKVVWDSLDDFDPDCHVDVVKAFLHEEMYPICRMIGMEDWLDQVGHTAFLYVIVLFVDIVVVEICFGLHSVDSGC